MSAAKHTPGPWVRFPELDDETGEPTGRLELSIHGPEWTQEWNGITDQVRDTVCVLGFSAHDRHEANARLIAAAPDLLHALDPETLEAVANEIDCFEHSARASSLRLIAKAQLAAIAKATGEGA